VTEKSSRRPHPEQRKYGYLHYSAEGVGLNEAAGASHFQIGMIGTTVLTYGPKAWPRLMLIQTVLESRAYETVALLWENRSEPHLQS
jgi:hypothetical protein